MLGGLGVPELVLILVIVILIFGTSRIPELGKGLGEGIRNFRKSMKRRRRAEEAVSLVSWKPAGARVGRRPTLIERGAGMRKTVLAVALLGVVVVTGCHKPKGPPPPPPPAAPATPPPAPEPPPSRDVAPVEDEYTRLKNMASDEIDRMGILADVHFDYDKADIREADRAILNRERGGAQEVRLPEGHRRGALRRARDRRVQPRPRRAPGQGRLRLPRRRSACRRTA